MMKIVNDRPPLFDLIDAKFGIAGKPVIFAWGDTIYNPLGGSISPELMAHEAVHGERQGTDVEGWWRRYLDDPAFRLEEEIPAHRAEYLSFCERNKDRNARASYRHDLAMRLSSPLYGRMTSYHLAKSAID